ncbi:MAG: hypothetical protein ACKO38_04195 [Planctomycetota bacterium]
MSARYLVACGCGATVAASPGQAGQEARCECGRMISIPLLRELRSLPQVEPPAVSKAANGRRSAVSVADTSLRGRVIYAGFLLTILATLLGGVLLVARSRIGIEWSQELQSQADSQVIDSMNADEMFQAWHTMHTQGLGEKAPTSFMINRNNRAMLGRFATWTLAIAAVAAAGTIGYSVASRPAAGS